MLIRVLAFFIITASSTCRAFYNPEQGRWLIRDPIGEEEGPNLSAFVKNDAANAWDYLGQAEKPGCCCCCCAENVELFDLRKAEQPELDLFGHSFRVAVSIQYIRSETSSDCTFSWKEKSNRPPPFAKKNGAKPDEWYETVAMSGSLSALKWDTHTVLCPGSVGVWIPDDPMSSTKEPKRVLDFEITIESSRGCPCKNTSKKLYAQQTLAGC